MSIPKLVLNYSYEDNADRSELQGEVYVAMSDRHILIGEVYNGMFHPNTQFSDYTHDVNDLATLTLFLKEINDNTAKEANRSA